MRTIEKVGPILGVLALNLLSCLLPCDGFARLPQRRHASHLDILPADVTT